MIYNITMEGHGYDDYPDYERKFPIRKSKRKKEGPPTQSDKIQSQQEMQAARQARAKEAEDIIKRHLSFFPEEETNKGREQVESYVRWVRESLTLGRSRLNPDDPKEVEIEAIIASVKAGGQNRQKNETAIRAKHLPTQISAKNEDERHREQNKQLALTALVKKLEEHLKLWETIAKGSPVPLDVADKVTTLIELPK